MVDENTYALIEDVLDEALNNKLQEVMAKILRLIENIETDIRQGSPVANPIARVAHPIDMEFFNANDYFKDKAARVEKEHAKEFELMSQKLEKLQASLRKLVGNLRLMILRT